MSRIQLTDTLMDMIVKMSEGNMGASTALMDIMTKHNEIDPEAVMCGVGAIMLLDTWEIYGSDIYVLWNDKCDRDVRKMLMIMRSCQMGNFSHQKLKVMAADQTHQVNLTEEEWMAHDEWVCDQLTSFKKAA
jgi:hypothetical protein